MHRKLSINLPLKPSRHSSFSEPELRFLFLARYTLNMVTLTQQEVERRLNTVPCAICKQSSFAIDERFMGADGDWRGLCKKCFYTFPVYADMEFYLRTQPDVPLRLKEISCTACNHRGVSLDLRATLSVRDAYYFVTCQGCQRQFVEKSSLEAFE